MEDIFEVLLQIAIEFIFEFIAEIISAVLENLGEIAQKLNLPISFSRSEEIIKLDLFE